MATGAMLQGIGTMAGAAAVAFAAFVGRDTFTSWKRQKLEERRMETAERILTLAYRLRYDFRSVRSPLMEQHELEAAEELLTDQQAEWWERQDESSRRRARTAQAAFSRLKRHNDDFQAIWELKPIALAFFGEKAETALDTFWQQYVAISVAAESYAEDDGSNRDFSRQLRQDLWQTSDDNPVSEAINAAVSELETQLRPIVSGDRE